MVLEYVTVILGVIAGITTTFAYIYRRGRDAGLDSAGEQSIKKDIQGVKLDVDEVRQEQHDLRKHTDKIHGEIFINIQRMDSKIDQIKGSTEVIENLFRDHIARKP